MKRILVAGIATLALLGLTTSNRATTAYWTDSYQSSGWTINTSHLDLTVGPSAGEQHLQGTTDATWAHPGLAVDQLYPGESLTATIVLANSGGTAMTVNGVVSASSNDLDNGANGVRLSVYDNSSAGSTSGSAAAMNRQTPCNGGTEIYAADLSSAEASVWPADFSLAVGANRSICVRVELAATAPTTMQGRSAAINFRFGAEQQS